MTKHIVSGGDSDARMLLECINYARSFVDTINNIKGTPLEKSLIHMDSAYQAIPAINEVCDYFEKKILCTALKGKDTTNIFINLGKAGIFYTAVVTQIELAKISGDTDHFADNYQDVLEYARGKLEGINSGLKEIEKVENEN